jgi:hypothetical protein
VISTLPFSPEQKELFDAVMDADQEEYPAANIQRVLYDEWGINAKITALKNHRRKDCMCFRGKIANRTEEND